MSLTGALNNAIGGLAVNSKSAAIVSSNISNALTEGYARRELILTSDGISTHGGVRASAVIQHRNPVLLAERRSADAASGEASDLQAFRSVVERVIGSVTDDSSLSGLLTQFDTALISAASDPASMQRLGNVAEAAERLVSKFNDISDQVQNMRSQAEYEISSMVDQLNDSLQSLETLNKKISVAQHSGSETATLIDLQHQEIDRIAELIPIRTLQRENGQVAIMSQGGTMLLDGQAAELSFERANAISAGMTVEDGALSLISLNGKPLPGDGISTFSGGRLAAQFAIRDDTATNVEQSLDALALELATAFGPNGMDATLTEQNPGIFTDRGSLASAANQTGLAARLSLNTAVAPDADTIWKLRDGLMAQSPGDSGDSNLLNSMRDALTNLSAPTAAGLPNVRQSYTTRMSEFMTTIADARVDSDREAVARSAELTTLKELEFAGGVDTDAELETLLRIEQSYAANAQVISTVDELLQQLLAI